MACHADVDWSCVLSKATWHAINDVIRPCMLSKVHDGMPRPTSSICVCNINSRMACHTRRCPTMCPIQGPWWYAMPDVIWPFVLSKDFYRMSRPLSSVRVCFPRTTRACNARHHTTCVLSKGDNGIPCFILLDRVCGKREMMACHTRRCSTVCAVEGLCRHATPDLIWLWVVSKSYDGRPHPTSFDYVWYPRDMMAYHARCRWIVCTF